MSLSKRDCARSAPSFSVMRLASGTKIVHSVPIALVAARIASVTCSDTCGGGQMTRLRLECKPMTPLH